MTFQPAPEDQQPADFAFDAANLARATALIQRYPEGLCPHHEVRHDIESLFRVRHDPVTHLRTHLPDHPTRDGR